jgi:hypothetical protein
MTTEERVRQIRDLLFNETGEKVTTYAVRFIIQENDNIRWREQMKTKSERKK